MRLWNDLLWNSLQIHVYKCYNHNFSFRVLNSNRKPEISNILANTNESCPTLPAPCTTTTTVPTQSVAQPTPTFSNSCPPMSHFLKSVDHHNQSMNLNPTDVYHSILYGSTITGGTFNMNIYFGHPENTTDSSIKRNKTKWKLCVHTYHVCKKNVEWPWHVVTKFNNNNLYERNFKYFICWNIF
jgi:hypothetical protein